MSAEKFVRYRLPWLLDQCTGKRVLHVGCAAAARFEQRLAGGFALHPLLAEVAAGLLGVDIDEDALELVRKAGFTQLLNADLCESPEPVIRELEKHMGGCDVILCGEVLEHVPNAGKMLAGVREVSRRFDAGVILTVPNAFFLRGFLRACAGGELVHPDHKCYYSSKTMETLLRQSGYLVDDILFYADEVAKHGHSSAAAKVAKLVLSNTLVRLRPRLGQGVIVKAHALA